MEDRPVLGTIDRLAGEHRRAVLLDLGSVGERDEPPHRLLVDLVLRIVEEEVAEGDREALEAIGIVGEALAERHRGDRRTMRLERGERLEHCGIHVFTLSIGVSGRPAPDPTKPGRQFVPKTKSPGGMRCKPERPPGRHITRRRAENHRQLRRGEDLESPEPQLSHIARRSIGAAMGNGHRSDPRSS